MATAVVIAGDERMRSLLRAGVGAVAGEVIEASEPEEVPAGCAAELAVVAVGDDARGGIRRVGARLGGDCELVLVGDVAAAAAVDALQADARVVAVLAAERATPAALAALAKRLTGHGFGLAGWLPAGTAIETTVVASYADKLRCIDKLQRAAEAALIRGKYRDAIAECADELLMNALYAAPRVAAAGGPAAGKHSLAERLARTVHVEWARAGDWFHLAVRDRWGSLRREALLDSWGGAAAAGARADGGAGLGMSIVAASSTGVHFTCAPGVATECLCSFDTRQTKLLLQEVGLVREADPARLARLKRALAPPPPPPVASIPSAMRVLIAALILILVILILTLALR